MADNKEPTPEQTNMASDDMITFKDDDPNDVDYFEYLDELDELDLFDDDDDDYWDDADNY